MKCSGPCKAKSIWLVVPDILKKYRDEANNNDNGTARSKNDDEEQKVDLNRIITDIPQFKYQLKELKYIHYMKSKEILKMHSNHF